MHLIYLTGLGGLIGWLAQHMTLSEGQDANRANVVVGALGATLGGWMVQPGGTASALLGAALGAGLFLSIANLLRRRGIP